MSDSEAAERSLVLARHYLEVDRPAQALEVLERGGEGGLDRVDWWGLRGQALLDLDRIDEAAEALRRGLSLDPQEIALLQLLSGAETRRGDLAQAERAILEALQIAPDEPALLCQYAWVVALGGQLEKADRLVLEAARIDPEHAAVVLARYRLADLRDRPQETLAHTREWLGLQPDSAWGHAARGLALTNAGQVSEGNRALSRAAAIDPRVVEGLEEQYEASRLLAHWSMRPLVPLQRLGPAKVWGIAVVLWIGLRAVGQSTPALIFGGAYLLFCVYSWVAPPLVRRHLRRRKAR